MRAAALLGHELIRQQPCWSGADQHPSPANLLQALQALVVAEPRVVQAVHGMPDLAILLEQRLPRGLKGDHRRAWTWSHITCVTPCRAMCQPTVPSILWASVWRARARAPPPPPPPPPPNNAHAHAHTHTHTPPHPTPHTHTHPPHTPSPPPAHLRWVCSEDEADRLLAQRSINLLWLERLLAHQALQRLVCRPRGLLNLRQPQRWRKTRAARCGTHRGEAATCGCTCRLATCLSQARCLLHAGGDGLLSHVVQVEQLRKGAGDLPSVAAGGATSVKRACGHRQATLRDAPPGSTRPGSAPPVAFPASQSRCRSPIGTTPGGRWGGVQQSRDRATWCAALVQPATSAGRSAELAWASAKMTSTLLASCTQDGTWNGAPFARRWRRRKAAVAELPHLRVVLPEHRQKRLSQQVVILLEQRLVDLQPASAADALAASPSHPAHHLHAAAPGV